MADRAIVVRRGEGRQYRSPLGDVLDAKVADDEAYVAYSLHERVAPPASRAAPHVHRAYSEAFYVIDGSLSVTVEDEEIDAQPGTFVLVPKGARHGWRNSGAGDARVLVIFTPAQRRAYFDELDALTNSNDGRPAMEDVVALMKKHNQD